jgi:hypothetical protein
MPRLARDQIVDVVPVEGPARLPAGIELWEATIEWRADRHDRRAAVPRDQRRGRDAAAALLPRALARQ